MFVWFGFGSYDTLRGSAVLACPRCGQTAEQVLHETGRKLSIFFLPIGRFSKQTYLECTRCGHAYEVPAATAAAIERGESLPQRNPFDLR